MGGPGPVFKADDVVFVFSPYDGSSVKLFDADRSHAQVTLLFTAANAIGNNDLARTGRIKAATRTAAEPAMQAKVFNGRVPHIGTVMSNDGPMPIKFGVKRPSATAHRKETASGREARRRPAEPRTNRYQGIDQAPHVSFGVIGRRGVRSRSWPRGTVG